MNTFTQLQGKHICLNHLHLEHSAARWNKRLRTTVLETKTAYFASISD